MGSPMVNLVDVGRITTASCTSHVQGVGDEFRAAVHLQVSGRKLYMQYLDRVVHLGSPAVPVDSNG